MLHLEWVKYRKSASLYPTNPRPLFYQRDIVVELSGKVEDPETTKV
jgi:hypothetical protein